MQRTDEPALSLPLARQIDEACDRFEAQWKAGQTPRLEQFLSTADEPCRPAMLSALLPVELELLTRQGNKPTLAAYQQRFPVYGSQVAAVFEEASRIASEGTIPASASDTSRTDDNRVTANPPPERIGRFKVQRQLGEGGFGTVYLARDPDLDRPVAVKVPRSGLFQTADERARFLREARALAVLRHPNICPVYEVGEPEGRCFLVMAYLEGRPLSEVLKAGPRVAPRRAAADVRTLALAMAEAHRKGIVHRDLKPSNIMIDEERGELMIMDFGLAHRASAEDAQLTQSGQALGTPAYMSPEQANGELEKIGPACDVYSLGVILYELLTGQRPFQGSAAQVLVQVLHASPKPPSTLTQVDPALEAICLRAMARQRADRYADMTEFAAALSNYLSSAPERAATFSKDPPMRSTAPTSAPAGPFDPYSEWLKIPPARRPPTHYDLLGLADFEADAATIHRATMDRMANVRRYQLGVHSEAAQQLIGEVSRAFDCLSTPDRKRPYDQELLARLAQPQPIATKPAELPKPVALPQTVTKVLTPILRTTLPSVSPAPRRKRPRPPRWPWVGGIAAVVLLGIVLLVRTEHGTVRIELLDPDLAADVQIKVDGKIIDITGLDEPLRLEVGPHDLLVTGKNFETHTRTFTVREGLNPAVNVDLLPKAGARSVPELTQAAAAKPPSTTPAEPVALSSEAVKEMQATLQKAFQAKVMVQSSGLVEFFYDFSEPRQLDDWIVREPQSEWAVEDGWLASKKLASKNASDTRLFHRALFSGPRREIRYDAQGKYDLGASLCADVVNWREGYHVCVAGVGVGEEHVGFYYAPKTGSVDRPDGQKLGFTRVGPLDPMKTYSVNAVAERGKVSLAFNGEVLSSGTVAPEFLQTGRMTCLKLGYSHGKFTNVRVVGALDLQWYAELQRTGVSPSYPKQLRWPADALREGRIPAPDLRKAKVLFKDEFDDPKSGFSLRNDSKGAESGYEGGRYFIRRLVSTAAARPTPWTVSDFACEVIGRVKGGDPKDHWALSIDGVEPDQRRGFIVRLNHDGSYSFGPTANVLPEERSFFPMSRSESHSAIKPGDGFNTLLLVVRSRQILIYVNGVAVHDPITVERDVTPGLLFLWLGSAAKTGEAEFERITVWSAVGLPTPEERLAKDEFKPTKTEGSPKDPTKVEAKPQPKKAATYVDETWKQIQPLLAERKYSDAIELVRTETSLDDAGKEQLERLQQDLQALVGFLTAVEGGLTSLKPGAKVRVRGASHAFESYDPAKQQLQTAIGTSKKTTPLADLHAADIAELAEPILGRANPQTKLTLGIVFGVDQQGNIRRARELLFEAEAAGLDVARWLARFPEPAEKAAVPNKLPNPQNLPPPQTIMTADGMKLNLVPSGAFTMGSATGDANEQPARRVTISRPFYIGVHEVTQRQYQAVMGDNPSGFKGDDLPVEMIAWEDAVQFCERLSEREHRKFRLPTEAEWEYACRGGTTSAWPFGEQQSQAAEYGWCQENAADKTWPVGQKQPNPLGLYDMHGNVWEFCSDWYGPYPAAAEQDPQGPIAGPYRVFRGGSYFFPSGESRSSNRPDKRFPAKGSNLGFRVVAEPGALPGK